MISTLKLQIAGTIFILMAFALLIGNVVAVLFWQKEMVRSEIAHAGAVLEIVTRGDLPLEAQDIDLSDDLAAICSMIGGNCIGAGFYDGRAMEAYELGVLKSEAENVARNALLLTEQTERLVGSMWGVFFSSSRYLLVASPWPRGGVNPGAAVVILELGSIYETIRDDHKYIFIYLLINICILTFLGMYRMSNLIVKPIERMIKVSEKFQDSDNIFFSDAKESSEFSRLNTALNSMLMRIDMDRDRLRTTISSLEDSHEELVKAHNDVVKAEKLASAGRLSAGVAHEIGNPIGIIQGYVELLQRVDIDAQERMQYGERALSELDRISRLIRQLLDYAASSPKDAEAVTIDRELFSVVLDLAAIEKRRRNAEIDMNIEAGLTVCIDRGGLQQVLLNCILNCLDAIEAADGDAPPVIAVSAYKSSDPAGADMVRISIEDNGVGFDQEAAGQLFDPFYTSKETGKGTGLGLFVSHNIIGAAGGSIDIENNEQGGVTVRITLPLHHLDDTDD